jgi:hypothetical protein
LLKAILALNSRTVETVRKRHIEREKVMKEVRRERKIKITRTQETRKLGDRSEIKVG